MIHLSQRVAWHDNRWNGTVCRAPGRNTYCVALENVRTRKDEEFEQENRGKPWDQLSEKTMPACVGEAGAFMSPLPHKRLFAHPYIELWEPTHGHLRPTTVQVPPRSFFAVPFWWMLQENQEEIQSKLTDPLPEDEPVPWGKNPWVFGKHRQRALLDLFFDRFKPDESLVIFYCKDGQPFGDSMNRLIVGVGKITRIGKMQWYDLDPKSSKDSYPIWDRTIQHTIKPDGEEGFLIPYHDYLEPTADPEEDARRRQFAQDIAVAVAPEHLRSFSYFSDYVGWDATLSALTSCMNALQLVKQHGIAKGPWERREEWLNQQIAAVWKDRGAFPGLGSALESLGVRLGTSLAYDLVANNMLTADDNPWPLVAELFSGSKQPPNPSVYNPAIAGARNSWNRMDSERKALLQLLSRFDLQPEQTKRWFDPETRSKSCEAFITDEDILQNPYQIAELDLGDPGKPPIAVNTIDLGLLPETTIANNHPVPEPSRVESYLDWRRVRSVMVHVLRTAADAGDSLLSERDVLDRVSKVQLPHPCELTSDWLTGNRNSLVNMIDYYALERDGANPLGVLQLAALKGREDRLRKVLLGRAKKSVPSTAEDWHGLLKQTLGTKKPHPAALDEQAIALEQITTRRLSVLTGRAGTGKTSALGALLLCEQIKREGVLLLAPTGKARVRLNRAVGADSALTVAQFLFRQGAYDFKLQRPKPELDPSAKFASARTVVIDECSMLTMNDLAAVLNVLDLGHVQRIILVGDPNQLPPIGVGRPFADICASLEAARDSSDQDTRNLGDALGRLTIEVRTLQTGEPSDLLKLASWFTREPQSVDADDIFGKLDAQERLNDLEYHFWKEPEELYSLLFQLFQTHLGLESPTDWSGFNAALGINGKNGSSPEYFQILSPVRMEPHGVYAVNNLIQKQYRGSLRRKPQLGDEKISLYDKVIQIRNQDRTAYSFGTKQKESVYVANGEIGLAFATKEPFVNVRFSDRPDHSFSYASWDFDENSPALELAYSLTVHKTQGSEFEYVFVILPKHTRLLSRELLYTAFTRARKKLILLIEGDDLSPLFDYSRPEKSETVRRNTNLFTGAVRAAQDEMPFSEHLIHRAEKGHLVRSKSELVIANMLYGMGVSYQYEERYQGMDGRIVLPDFRFTDPAGDVIIWEHLGMLSRDDYRQSWERKLKWYTANGLLMGENLFTTADDDNGGLDSIEVRRIAERIRAML